MQNLECLLLKTAEKEEVDKIITYRDQLIKQGLAEDNIALLEAISAIDKQNMKWLQQQKQGIQKELSNLSKISHYVKA